LLKIAINKMKKDEKGMKKEENMKEE